MLECANTENCRQAKIIAVGSKNIVFDKTAIILHMLEDPGITWDPMILENPPFHNLDSLGVPVSVGPKAGRSSFPPREKLELFSTRGGVFFESIVFLGGNQQGQPSFWGGPLQKTQTTLICGSSIYIYIHIYLYVHIKRTTRTHTHKHTHFVAFAVPLKPPPRVRPVARVPRRESESPRRWQGRRWFRHSQGPRRRARARPAAPQSVSNRSVRAVHELE